MLTKYTHIHTYTHTRTHTRTHTHTHAYTHTHTHTNRIQESGHGRYSSFSDEEDVETEESEDDEQKAGPPERFKDGSVFLKEISTYGLKRIK